ncbi:MAG TPA: antibiotic biosynthesis monooxygenase [Verrucomicrobiae bacterium]|nr:antibiotic biosynthesis monooxygenase [Verrucomicrobiae bacterium]
MAHFVTIFRSRLRPEHAEQYHHVADRIHQLAVAMPGFVDIKTFAAPDGERVSIVEFESEAAHNAWREHPEHRMAQKLGREKFYSEFRIQVCRVERDYSHENAPPPQVTPAPSANLPRTVRGGVD